MKFTKSLTASNSLISGYLSQAHAFAGETNVAVAANFTEAAKEIATAFKAKTSYDLVLSFGAS